MGLFDRFRHPQGDRDPEVETLCRQLQDSDWTVRRDAARTLGDLGRRAAPAMAELEEAIADENGEVCLAASDALSKIRIAAH